MPEPSETRPVERVQLGVRMEKTTVQVLKGLAEFKGTSLAALLENIVWHSFEPLPGQKGEWCASPHGKRDLEVIAGLQKVYSMKFDVHGARGFADDSQDP